MPEDPIVEEIHRIRRKLLDDFGGDVDALMDEANRRLLNGEFGPRKIVSFPPRRPKHMPEPAHVDPPSPAAHKSRDGWLSPAWIAELDRREAEYQAGLVELIDHDEALARLRAGMRDVPAKTDPTHG